LSWRKGGGRALEEAAPAEKGERGARGGPPEERKLVILYVKININ
jgi:hypothetical protein